jgi:lipoic acid synthetase
LYQQIRPGASYRHSLDLLRRAKRIAPLLFTKSGIMLGLGETREEVEEVMDDLRAAAVDFMTIGQYLRPTPKHASVVRYWTPEEFAELGRVALAKGFGLVASSPMTRSSYHADDDFQRLRQRRAAEESLTASDR